MPKYLMFYESDIITSFDIEFNYFQRKSIVVNKIHCSFLDKKDEKNSKNILESLNKFFPKCEVIEFGKIAFRLEREYIIAFILFKTEEILFDNFNDHFYPRGSNELFKKKVLEIRNSLSKSFDTMIVKKFISNIFLPEQLKDNFRRNIEKILQSKERAMDSSTYRYYQNYKRYPFLIEFQTNLCINFKDELEKSIKEYYTILSPFIDQTGSLLTFEFSFCNLKVYSLEKFDMSEIAKCISTSFLNYIVSLYTRIIDNMTIYRKRIEFLSRKLKKLSGKVLIKLYEQLNELKRGVFEEFPLLYISVIDKYIIYEDDIENPDLTNQIFWNKESNLLMFRRYLKLLNEKITDIQSEIKTLLLYKRDRITLFTKAELKEKLECLNNEIEFQDLLAEILKELQFEDVTINCGTRGHQEFGKDIVFSYKNKFNQREWSAVVVKFGKITQSQSIDVNRKVKELIDQGSIALDISFKDDKGSEFRITKVFVATNDIITDYAKKVIVNKLGGQVFFIDKDILLDLVE